MSPDSRADVSPVSLAHTRFLNLLEERRDGRVEASAFLEQADSILEGFPLYPRDALLAIGSAAGRLIESSPAEATDIVLELLSSGSSSGRAVTAMMVWHLARLNPGIWTGVARHLVLDEDWEVRDIAAHVLDCPEGYDGAADFHPDFVFEEIGRWVSDPDDRVRRAATQALLGFVAKHPDFSTRLIEILHPLLEDESEHVCRSHAQALWTVGRKQPRPVLQYIEACLSRLSEHTRETFRLVLSQPFADKLPDEKRRLLAKLS